MKSVTLTGNTDQSKLEYLANAAVGLRLVNGCDRFMSDSDIANISESVGVAVQNKQGFFEIVSMDKSKMMFTLSGIKKRANERITEAQKEVDQVDAILKQI